MAVSVAQLVPELSMTVRPTRIAPRTGEAVCRASPSAWLPSPKSQRIADELVVPVDRRAGVEDHLLVGADEAVRARLGARLPVHAGGGARSAPCCWRGRHRRRPSARGRRSRAPGRRGRPPGPGASWPSPKLQANPAILPSGSREAPAPKATDSSGQVAVGAAMTGSGGWLTTTTALSVVLLLASPASSSTVSRTS